MTLVQNYVRLVDSEFIQHLGANSKPTELPDKYRNGKTPDLSEAQKRRLKERVQGEFEKISGAEDGQLLEDFGSAESIEVLKVVLEVAKELKIPSPSERLAQILGTAFNKESNKPDSPKNSTPEDTTAPGLETTERGSKKTTPKDDLEGSDESQDDLKEGPSKTNSTTADKTSTETKDDNKGLDQSQDNPMKGASETGSTTADKTSTKTKDDNKGSDQSQDDLKEGPSKTNSTTADKTSTETKDDNKGSDQSQDDPMKGASETGLTTPDKTIKKEDEDDTYSAFGDPWAPGSRGKERSASPMQEEEQEKLQDILREHCQAAIPKLKEYISGDQASATSLEESNVRLQGLISNIMGRPISGKAKFRIPYEKIKDVVDPLVVQPLQNPSSETQENEYATKLGESRIGLYHVCLQSNIDISWLKGLLGTERHTKHVTSNPLYSSINTDVTTYWPYSFLETSNYVILYEKQIKISSDRNRSSFGVQVFDPNTKKFRVETRATINNDDLQRWRVLPNAFKFEAANRGFDGGKDSIDYIYFYTMKQPKTGGPDSLESAHTDVCVKPKNSMFPRLLPRSQVNGKLADGESIEPILEIFSGRDDIKKPWGFRAKKMVCDLTGEKAKWRPQTTLEEEFWKLRNEGAASLRGVSPFSNAPASPENTALAEKSASRASPFSQRSYSQRPSLQEKTPVVEDQEELGRQGMEIEKIKKRLDNIEDNLVTPAYIDNAMERNNKKLVELIKGQSAGEG